MAGDCRDRYRNHLEHGQGRHKGSWKPAEEETLTRLVLEAREKMAAANDNEKDSDVFWGEISKQMEYTRSRQQCRTKWCVYAALALRPRCAVLIDCLDPVRSQAGAA